MGNRQSISIDDQIFNMKFTSKQLIKQSSKSEKEVVKEKNKLSLAIQQGNLEGARVYASNAIRKKNEALQQLQLSSRLDGITSKLSTISCQRGISKSIAHISNDIGIAMINMNTMAIAECMDKFDRQLQELDVQSDVINNLMDETNLTKTPVDDVDTLISIVAEECGLELEEQFPNINNKFNNKFNHKFNDTINKETNAEDDLMKRLDKITN